MRVSSEKSDGPPSLSSLWGKISGKNSDSKRKSEKKMPSKCGLLFTSISNQTHLKC